VGAAVSNGAALGTDEESKAGAKGAILRFLFEALAHELIPVTVQSIRGGEGGFDHADIRQPGHEPASIEFVIGEGGGGVLGEILDLHRAIHDTRQIGIDGRHGITSDDTARRFEGFRLRVGGEHLQAGETGRSEDALDVSGKRSLEFEIEGSVIGVWHGSGSGASELGSKFGADFFFDAVAKAFGAFVRIEHPAGTALDIGIRGVGTGIGKAEP
jgi:hypothetical protein